MAKFCQEDHVRLYGCDFKQRLEKYGLIVEEYNFEEVEGKEKAKKYGILEGGCIYIISKDFDENDMKNLNKIYKKHDGKEVDLSKMTLTELEYLNLEEEEFYAKEILKREKFSKERNEYSKQAYTKIFQIADWKSLYKNNKSAKKSHGVTDKTLDFLNKLIDQKKEEKKEENKKKNKEEVFIYEAGVGKGYALENLANKGISIKGCDVFLSEEAKKIEAQNSNISLTESDLYSALDSIEENSIDVFYADNVMEHIAPDEYNETCKKIFSKVKEDGLILFIIPDANTGPSDISRLRFPNGGKATGFHFMEQTYKQNIKTYKELGADLKYFCYRRKKGTIFYNENRFYNFLKIYLELILAKRQPKIKRDKLFKKLGYDIYVLEIKK